MNIYCFIIIYVYIWLGGPTTCWRVLNTDVELSILAVTARIYIYVCVCVHWASTHNHRAANGLIVVGVLWWQIGEGPSASSMLTCLCHIHDVTEHTLCVTPLSIAWLLCHLQNCVAVLNSSPPRQKGRRLADDISDAFSWIKSFVFWLQFHWNFFLMV